MGDENSFISNEIHQITKNKYWIPLWYHFAAISLNSSSLYKAKWEFSNPLTKGFTWVDHRTSPDPTWGHSKLLFGEICLTFSVLYILPQPFSYSCCLPLCEFLPCFLQPACLPAMSPQAQIYAISMTLVGPQSHPFSLLTSTQPVMTLPLWKALLSQSLMGSLLMMAVFLKNK